MDEKKSLYKIGKTLGLNAEDINAVLNNTVKVEPLSFEIGPDPYWSTTYGTISINDF